MKTNDDQRDKCEIVILWGSLHGSDGGFHIHPHSLLTIYTIMQLSWQQASEIFNSFALTLIRIKQSIYPAR